MLDVRPPVDPDHPVEVVASVHGVGKRFGPTTALDGVHLAVAAGEIHGLAGRSGSGRSTLVSILTGMTTPDAGRVRFDGQPAPALADRPAWRRLVACVPQNPTLIPSLTVAENLYINQQPGKHFISWRRLRRQAAELLEGYGVPVKPAQMANQLTIEQRHLVATARALSSGVRFIVLDCPTAALEGALIDRLFASLHALRATGVSILYLPHHAYEVHDLCQTVTVLRDGRGVLSQPVGELTREELLSAMTGGTAAAQPHPAPDLDHTVLSVSALSLVDCFEGVDLSIRAGEIIGVAGLAGSGKVALAETVAGRRRPTEGTVAAEGSVALVAADMLLPQLSLAENVTLPIAAGMSRHGFLDPRKVRAAGRSAIAEFGISARGPGVAVRRLPAGQARKVAFAKAMFSEPKVLVLIDPTAGVDLAARQSLWSSVKAAAAKGLGVLMVSDDLQELKECDRVVAMYRGQVVLDAPRGWAEADVIAAIEGEAS